MLSSVLNNALTSKVIATLLATIIISIVAYFFKRHRDYKDSNKIYRFLYASSDKTKFEFRSTQAISSSTRIPESRVAELCSKDKRIKRNELEKQSWRVIK